MTTIYPSQPHNHSRLRSSSDPFVDPANRSKQRPPPPPPKTKNTTRMPAAVLKSAPNRDTDITEAVRDTVTVRGQTDYSPRTRMGRSQTAIAPTTHKQSSGRRSQSQDSGSVHEKSKTGKPRKKSSQHADVIDRLDFTGVGPMFHHDGPFDACAPSRNKHRNKAPMFAWGIDDQAYGDSAYPSADAYKAFSNNYVEPPKKKVDAIAEAWGIHEPEPFEEFFAGGGSSRPEGDTPASSIYNGKDSRSAARGRGKDTREEVRPRANVRRSVVPPPQPIFVPDAAEVIEPPSNSPPLSPGAPKRSKSLMHRIRKMRDAPNVPVTADYDQSPPSPTSPNENYPGGVRPTHRSQNSFLGRFGGPKPGMTSSSEKPEPYVFIDAQNNKDLPAPPSSTVTGSMQEVAPPVGYFDSNHVSGPGSPGLGRKTSIMQKVGRVVRGNR